MKKLNFGIFLVCTLTATIGYGQGNPRQISLASGIDNVQSLHQNWTDAESIHFYNIAQGSRLIPYDLFIHLEQVDSQQLFRSPQHMRELGYIPRIQSSDNPDGLPIGFIKDTPYNTEIAGLGITCAACHTGLIVSDKTAYIVDGAPTMGDFETFLKRLTAAISKTAEDSDKFSRLVASVLPENSSDHLINSLLTFIRSIATERTIYDQRNLPVDDNHRYGHGRVDAFGAIFNQVSAQFLDIPENATAANAPVSYPSLWDAPQHDRVQWNGAAENSVNQLGILLFGTDKVGALGRNTGEVLGVFGDVSIHRHEILLPRRYDSTVVKKNLLSIEQSLEKLWSPAWPFSPIDNEDEIRQRGKLIYQDSCLQCHAMIKRDDPNRRVKAHLEDVGTDQTLLKNFARVAKTGRLEGRLITILGKGRFQAEEPVGVILRHVVERTILNSLSLGQLKEMIQKANISEIDLLNPGYRNIAIIKLGDQEYRIPFDKLKEGSQSVEILSGAAALLQLVRKSKQFVQTQPATEDTLATVQVQGATATPGYKARPLNGVWATAPYLHNGSVATLAELLKPVSKRKKLFHVGSLEFDLKNVGFVDDPQFPVFDTAVEGNRNTGHEFGINLSRREKTDLIEYIKSL